MKTIEEIETDIETINNLIVKSNLMQDDILKLQFYINYLKCNTFEIQDATNY